MAANNQNAPEVSIVMPCLNEVETLAICIEKASQALSSNNIAGEIIVADNGSTDGSQAIATRLGSRLVNVEERGYGNALMGGIAAAKGKFIIMGDADDSYDFNEIPSFVEKLKQGFDLVQGCRLPSGGGTIIPGAMPFLHRVCGNPMFSFLARWWFKSPLSDVYCGLRGFKKDFQLNLYQRCTGMEFATEMIIKASLSNARITEVPITLHLDGRKTRAPHLRTFRDGWRTIRLFLFSGIVGYAIAMPGVTLNGVTFDAHTLLFASLAILCGHQSVIFAIFTKTFAINERLLPEDPRMTRFFEVVNLERGLVISLTALLAGVVLLAAALNAWRLTGFGHMDYAKTMRLVIPGATLTALGFQTILASFFVSILGMRRR